MKKGKIKAKKVLVFGTFDGVHDGHRYFLHEAKKWGDKLVVAVSRDLTVRKLKGRSPDFPLSRRIKDLELETIADKIVPSDSKINTWKILKKERPYVVCLGYDQKELAVSITEILPNFDFEVKVVYIKDYNGRKFHSSLIRKTQRSR